MLVPINITGPTYVHRARSQSAQRTVGLFPEILDTEAGKSKYILNSFPGLKLFGTAPGGKDRGMFEHKGNVYKVTGTNLSTIDKNGIYNSKGTIPGSGRCIFSGIGDNVVIVSDGKAYIYIPSPALSNFAYSSYSFPVDGQETGATGIFFKPDGTVMYVCGNINDSVYQYDLEIPWNVSTASYSGKSLSFGTQPSNPTGITFSADGYHIYGVAGSTYQYDMTTAWDVSTGSYSSNSLDVTTQESNPQGMVFKPDGFALYVVGYANDTVYQYTLTTPWDISTASYASKSLSVTSEETVPNGIFFNSDGTSLYIVGNTNDTVYEYTLTTAWDVSTGSYSSNSLDTSTEVTTAQDLYISPDGTNIYIINSGGPSTQNIVVQYSSLKEITDTDLETPNSCAHLNNQILYDGDGGRFCSSDVGDATSINSLNYATAEVSPDNIKRVYVFNQILYLMGEKTIESWYNSGVGSPPFDRIEGGLINIGLSAIYSVSNNDSFVYFLGDDNQVYQLAGTNTKRISSNALVKEFQSYSSIEDAIGYNFTFDNQYFYMLNFPSEQKSWCYSEESQQWFEPNESLYPGFSNVYAFRKNLIADGSNGNIYELDPDTYDQNGVLVERWRDTGPIHGGLVNAPGKKIELNRFELIMEVGIGELPSTTDNRENPYVMLSISTDGGKTFGTERWRQLGQMSQYVKVEWNALGSFYEAVIRIKFSDPNYYSIHSAAAELEIGI